MSIGNNSSSRPNRPHSSFATPNTKINNLQVFSNKMTIQGFSSAKSNNKTLKRPKTAKLFGY